MTNEGTPPVKTPEPTLLDLNLQTKASPENPSTTKSDLNNDPTKNPFWKYILQVLSFQNRFNDPENIFWFLELELANQGVNDQGIKKVLCSVQAVLPGTGIGKPKIKYIKAKKMIDCEDTTRPHN